MKGVSPIECPTRTFIEQTNLGEAIIVVYGDDRNSHWHLIILSATKVHFFFDIRKFILIAELPPTGQ